MSIDATLRALDKAARSTPAIPAVASAARPRKLGVAHFAFMRAIVQGVDARASWERYLPLEGEATDKVLVRSTTALIRTEFAAAAKREDRFGTARLVRLDVAAIPSPSSVLPSLDAFAEDAGLAECPQAEQIAAFEAAYGKETARLKRRARLVERQLEALAWLQGLVAQSPRPGDALAAWIHPTLAARLHGADIFTRLCRDNARGLSNIREADLDQNARE